MTNFDETCKACTEFYALLCAQRVAAQRRA